MTIEGKEVLLTRPSFATPPRIVGRREKRKLDVAQARTLIGWNGKAAIHGFQHEHCFQARADFFAFMDFFYDRRGRWSRFWVPSWHAELSPTATVANGATSLSISPVNYATVFPITPSDLFALGNYVWLLSNGGDFHVSKVTSVAGTSPEVLTLATATSVQFTLGQFIAGFLYSVRFAQDDLRMDFFGANNAETQTAFVEVLTSSSDADA